MQHQGPALALASLMVAGVGVWAAKQHLGGPEDLVQKISANAPFFGTPAHDYANGAAGVVAPEARAMAGFSATAVAGVYADAEKMVEAAALDTGTVLGGAPTAFLATIEPTGATAERTRSQVITLAPGSARLANPTIKAKGSMKAVPGTHGGVRGLSVTVDYLFVYGIQKVNAPGRIERLVTRLEGTTFQVPGSGARPTLLDQHVTAAPAECAAADGYIRPDFDGGGCPTLANPPVQSAFQ